MQHCASKAVLQTCHRLDSGSSRVIKNTRIFTMTPRTKHSLSTGQIAPWLPVVCIRPLAYLHRSINNLSPPNRRQRRRNRKVTTLEYYYGWHNSSWGSQSNHHCGRFCCWSIRQWCHRHYYSCLSLASGIQGSWIPCSKRWRRLDGLLFRHGALGWAY